MRRFSCLSRGSLASTSANPASSSRARGAAGSASTEGSRRWACLSVLGLLLTGGACAGDDSATSESGATVGATTTAGGETEESASEATTDAETTTTTDPTTTGPTTTDPTTTDPTTTGPTTTDPTTTGPTTTDPTTTGDSDSDSEGGICGNGIVEAGEVCDDGNTITELPGNTVVPHSYDEGDCLDACDLLAATCGDGVVDPGEACDDGNTNSHDGCTTSCTVNDGGFDSPCKRDCGGNQCSANDVLAGTIVGCANVTAPQHAEKVCFDSGHVKLLNIIDRKIYFAEGSCMVAAQKCEGAFCPGNVTFGNYDQFNDCPAGTSLADRVTESGGVKVSTKVCHRTCKTDSDCRWNAHDDFWAKPGQYRCQITPDSKGVKICADAQNF